jgi:hypothetical protein
LLHLKISQCHSQGGIVARRLSVGLGCPFDLSGSQGSIHGFGQGYRRLGTYTQQQRGAAGRENVPDYVLNLAIMPKIVHTQIDAWKP